MNYGTADNGVQAIYKVLDPEIAYLLPLVLHSLVVINLLILYCSEQIHENMLCVFKVVLSVIGSIQTDRQT